MGIKMDRAALAEKGGKGFFDGIRLIIIRGRLSERVMWFREVYTPLYRLARGVSG